MQKFGQRMLRFFLLTFIFSAMGFVLQACGGEDESTPDANEQGTNNDDTVEVSGLTVGDTAPAFALPATNGDEVSLSDYTGEQPVLLYFHMAVG